MRLSVTIKQDSDGTYVAVSPAVPECISRGASAKEVLDEHRVRVRQYVATSSDYFPDSIELHVVAAS